MRCSRSVLGGLLSATILAATGCGGGSDSGGDDAREPSAIGGFWRVRIELPPPRDADIIHWMLEENEGVVQGNQCTTSSEMVGGEWVLDSVDCDGNAITGDADGLQFELSYVDHPITVTGVLAADGNGFEAEGVYDGTLYPITGTRRDDELPAM